MKKLVLLSAFLTCSFALSQMAVKKLDGTIMNDGEVYKYSTYDTNNDMLNFTVANTSPTQSIKVKVLCEALTNTTGEDFEFCFGGNCMPFVMLGMNYPPNGYTIDANSNTGDFDHFWNKKESDQPMSFLFKFYQVDALGNEIGAPVRITYLYDKHLAVSNTSAKSEIVLKNTVVTDFIELDSKNNGTISIFDFTGKLVLNQEVKAGNNKISAQKLAAGVYIVNIVSSNGKISTTKIIKK
ncbi:T9SS type A sorting domain-containing protein [Kaistella flava (ex Peng et al. 2021)]|uniref:T9SS type A sorting domain-containing protein n=1 Tax=Kaistella flava (ex Peng et al. 2021) TaxID=2038776 RepID=A0A7M2Y6C6_9FLAO|nr:T9SS type A sorting domain-containing protein [Kaistella flava (ex Peng et al. 2021)]QOW08982.1 T9SS type A sorting domain-containing protein [Kaistella flava (ex Peng et al. 2021)]